jgi:hypothetical protein
MNNTGTFNSDFAVVLVLLMLAPIFIHFLMEIIKSLFPEENFSQNISIYESIKQTAITQAIEGNSSARTWVTKHVFENKEKIKNKTKNSSQPAKFLTNRQVMSDALEGLVKLKYKKDNAKKIVAKLGKKSEYKDPGVMIIDCIKEL